MTVTKAQTAANTPRLHDARRHAQPIITAAEAAKGFLSCRWWVMGTKSELLFEGKRRNGTCREEPGTPRTSQSMHGKNSNMTWQRQHQNSARLGRSRQAQARAKDGDGELPVAENSVFPPPHWAGAGHLVSAHDHALVRNVQRKFCNMVFAASFSFLGVMGIICNQSQAHVQVRCVADRARYYEIEWWAKAASRPTDSLCLRRLLHA